MKILITGGSGFIGTNFTAEAIKRGHKVYNIDNLSLFLTDYNRKSINYNFNKIDILKTEELNVILNKFKPDKVIHMAAESHVDQSIRNPEIFIQTNIMGTYSILQASLKYWKSLNKKNSFCFHHVSTDEVFGSLNTKDAPFTEKSNYKPNSPYSATKAGSDHIVRAWTKTYGLPTSITHCGNNFGPFQSPEKLIPMTIISCLKRERIPIYGTGENIRDWIYVKDHVQALLNIIEQNIINQDYVIGSRNEKTNNQLINEICDVYNNISKVKYDYKKLIIYVEDRLGHDFRYAVNPKLIEQNTNWAPENDFFNQIKETCIWYIENQSLWHKFIKN